MTAFSYQLYSSRNFPPLASTLSMLKELGYAQVEGFGGIYGDLPALKAALEASGLAMPSGHFGLDPLENDVAGCLGIARTLGMEAIFCPHIGPDLRPADAAGWRAFGARLQEAGKPYVEAGFTFGWHNHDFELKPLADGTIPLDALFEGGPDLAWEADIAWIVRGGGDPIACLEKHASRLHAIHVKDIAAEGECTDEDGWADVGHGTMDWPALMAASRKAGARYFVMEHDNPSDDKRFAARSITAALSF